jgi:hypothetical protein
MTLPPRAKRSPRPRPQPRCELTLHPCAVAALTNIGDLYYYGARGMPQDHAESLNHYRRAADAGNAGAMAKVCRVRPV